MGGFMFFLGGILPPGGILPHTGILRFSQSANLTSKGHFGLYILASIISSTLHLSFLIYNYQLIIYCFNVATTQMLQFVLFLEIFQRTNWLFFEFRRKINIIAVSEIPTVPFWPGILLRHHRYIS